MQQQLLESINNYLVRDELLKGEPATKEQIEQAESELGISLNNDFKEFIRLFGGSYVGIAIYGFNNCNMLASDTVISLTQAFRESYIGCIKEHDLYNSCVISVTGSGDSIAIDDKGRIQIYYHDSGESTIIAESFASLIAMSID